MSTEETREFTYNIQKRLSDDKVSLVKIPDGSHILELKAVDKRDVEDRCLWLERVKESSKDDESRQSNRIPPSTYNIVPTDSTIQITGDVDELEDAARTLHCCHNYISALKMEQLADEISGIRLKEIKTREHQARQDTKEKRNHAKYTQLAARLGMNKRVILKKSPETPAEKNSSHPQSRTTTSCTTLAHK